MLTWRTGVVLVVVILAFAVVMPSVRAYSDQQAMLSELRAEAEAARLEVDGLEADLARWDDPAYVVAQARERLKWVYPGETAYTVVDPEVVVDHADGSPAAERAPQADVPGTWYEAVWASVIVAGEGERPVVEPDAEPLHQPEEDSDDSLTDVDFGG